MGICSGKCTSLARLDGKTAIITGSNTGIGKFTALDFYKRGCRVIMACRNLAKGKTAMLEITQAAANDPNVGEVVVEELDLSSMQSVRDFADRILKREHRINLLVNNAGVMACPKSFTTDGFELQFGTNHLGHFLLTWLLLPRILNSHSSGPARIVNLSSLAHRRTSEIDWDDLNAQKTYSPTGNYCLSKLANVYFTVELARRLEGKNVNVYAVNPGVVNTDLGRHIDSLAFRGATWLYQNIGGIFQKNVEEGSQTSIYCAVDDAAGNQTGLYYSDCKPETPSALARDLENARKLWDISVKLLKLGDSDPFQVADELPRPTSNNSTYSEAARDIPPLKFKN